MRLYVVSLFILGDNRTEKSLPLSQFICNECNEIFETDGDLKLHQTTHVKSFTCIHCNKEFSSKYLIVMIYFNCYKIYWGL